MLLFQINVEAGSILILCYRALSVLCGGDLESIICYPLLRILVVRITLIISDGLKTDVLGMKTWLLPAVILIK
jgi:hypothetical protein